MLVYLDIDGVMIPDGADGSVIPVDKAGLLRVLLEQTFAKIVVTSHRRRSSSSVRSLLYTAGFDDIDFASNWMTPLDLDLDDDLSIRGQEIAAHLSSYSRFMPHVILDDVPMLPCQINAHIQPDPQIGLQAGHIMKAMRILRTPAIAYA